MSLCTLSSFQIIYIKREGNCPHRVREDRQMMISSSNLACSVIQKQCLVRYSQSQLVCSKSTLYCCLILQQRSYLFDFERDYLVLVLIMAHLVNSEYSTNNSFMSSSSESISLEGLKGKLVRLQDLINQRTFEHRLEQQRRRAELEAKLRKETQIFEQMIEKLVTEKQTLLLEINERKQQLSSRSILRQMNELIIQTSPAKSSKEHKEVGKIVTTQKANRTFTQQSFDKLFQKFERNVEDLRDSTKELKRDSRKQGNAQDGKSLDDFVHTFFAIFPYKVLRFLLNQRYSRSYIRSFSMLYAPHNHNHNLKESMSLGEISAMQQLMKIALTGQQHVDALIGYYRSEIDRYNDERAEWALHYEILKDNASNRYTLQQEIDQSRHKINDLESGLNTTKANLNKERQRYFEMLENSQAVKGRVDEHKKKYRDLVAVCKPINVNKSKLEKKNANSSQNSSRLSAVENQAKGEMELELINLGRQHDQKREILQKHLDSLKQELDEIISQHSARGKTCSHQYKQALQGLSDAQSKILHLTSQYFKLRMNSYEQQRRIQEQNQILRLKAVALAKKLQMLRDSHSQEFKSVDRQVKQRNKEFREKYDEQLRKKEEHLTILKEQNEKINHIYLLKLKKLEGELKEVTERQRSVEEKSKSEINSLRGQIRILKGRTEYEGVKEMRAEMAEEESQQSSEALSMSQLQKLNNEVQALKRRI